MGRVIFVSILIGICFTLIENVNLSLNNQEYRLICNANMNINVINPLMNSDQYILLPLRLPIELYENLNFHLTYAFVINIIFCLVILLIFNKLKFNILKSTFFCIIFLIIGKLLQFFYFNIPYPNPIYNLASNYGFRYLLLPLSGLCILALWHRKIFFTAFLIGVLFTFHAKFGLRFYTLVGGVLIIIRVLHYFGLWVTQISWKDISIFIGGSILFMLPTFYEIFQGLHVFEQMNGLRAEPLISPLAWLMKNEPDDWLVLFMPIRHLIAYVIFYIISNVIWYFFYQRDETYKKLSFILLIANQIAFVFFILGILFETYIDSIPYDIAMNLVLARFWDLLWVIVVTSILGICMLSWEIGVYTFNRLKFPIVQFEKLAFGISCSILVLALIYKYNKQTEEKSDKGFIITNSFQNGSIYQTNYIQVSDSILSNQYNQTRNRAIFKLKQGNNQDFSEELDKLNSIYFQVFADSLNYDVVNLKGLKAFRNNQYHLGYEYIMQIPYGEPSVLWKYNSKFPQISKQQLSISYVDYGDMCRWIKKNQIPYQGYITPPYINAFLMLSDGVWFWDNKIDQHMMYMVKSYYTMGLARCNAVLGEHTMETTLGVTGGTPDIRGVEYYQNLTEDSFLKIRQSYPKYNYIVTESSQKLSFPILYQNKSFILYQFP